MKTLTQIIAENALALASVTAAAKKTVAPQGETVPTRQHFLAEKKAEVASATLAEVVPHGYRIAAVRFGKENKHGARDLFATFRQPITKAERLARYRAVCKARDERTAARRALKEAALLAQAA